MTATLTVTEKHPEKGDVTLACVCTNQDGREAITGNAYTRAPREKIRIRRTILPPVFVGRHDALHGLLDRAAGGPPVHTAVVFPTHPPSLTAACEAAAAGLRGARRISHVYLVDVPGYPRPLLLTDAAINLRPDLDQKADIIRNAIFLAHVIGITAPVAGLADILVVPDLEAGNMLAKQLTFMSGAAAAGIVLGARVPIILTSRADSAQTRLASCALAVLVARHAP